MGLFTQKPKPYAPPPSAPSPTILGQTPAEETAPAPGGRAAVLVDLPGRPGSYLDSEFAPEVDAFVRYAREAGHELSFSSAYRPQEGQDDLITSGKGRMPAKHSLHSAGLAVDIGDFDGFAESKKLAIRKAAERAGLSWGGTFGDTIHFYLDPGHDRRELIDNFTGHVQRLQRGR
jgi:LAS superfamily LD-carboxypeptidase LdcB